MPVQVSLIVPQGTTAGQQISFVHTDGRNVSLILPDGVVPGQTLHVNVPDAPPEPGKSAAPPSQKPNKKKRKKKDTGDSDLDASDEEFVPGQTNRQDLEEDHEDDREDGKRNGDAGESSVVKTRPRRSSAAKAAEKFTNSVSDAMFEEALAKQSRARARALPVARGGGGGRLFLLPCSSSPCRAGGRGEARGAEEEQGGAVAAAQGAGVAARQGRRRGGPGAGGRRRGRD